MCPKEVVGEYYYTGQELEALSRNFITKHGSDSSLHKSQNQDRMGGKEIHFIHGAGGLGDECCCPQCLLPGKLDA